MERCGWLKQLWVPPEHDSIDKPSFRERDRESSGLKVRRPPDPVNQTAADVRWCESTAAVSAQTHTHTTKISHLGKPPTVCPFHSRLAALMAFFSSQRATAQSSPTREGHTGGEEKTRTAAPLTRREEMNVNVLTWIRRNGNTGLESFIWQRKLITVGSYSCLVE